MPTFLTKSSRFPKRSSEPAKARAAFPSVINQASNPREGEPAAGRRGLAGAGTAEAARGSDSLCLKVIVHLDKWPHLAMRAPVREETRSLSLVFSSKLCDLA